MSSVDTLIRDMKAAESRGRRTGSKLVDDLTGATKRAKFVVREFDTSQKAMSFVSNFGIQRKAGRLPGLTAHKRGNKVFVINWPKLTDSERLEIQCAFGLGCP